jgi:hypothetical protein
MLELKAIALLSNRLFSSSCDWYPMLLLGLSLDKLSSMG